jgi:hypothetical protein
VANSPGQWPASCASFGQVRAGGVKWDGVLLAGAQGTPVRAVITAASCTRTGFGLAC